MEMTAGEIAKFLDGKLEGDPDLVIKKLATLQGADANSIAFYADTTHENQLYESKASAVLLPLDFKLKKKMEATLIRVENPYLFFSKLMALFEKASQKTKTGIETPAFIGEQCQLGEEVYIGAFSYIGDHSILGENVSVYPGCWIGEHVKIGPHSTIYAGVKIYPNTEIGSHCILHAGAVIGSDGFGFLPMENKAGYQKIPQLGKVILEDHVEIGANTVIDRATLDATVVEKGTKLDNLVQIGHNVRIGKHTVIAAQTGVAGSARIGDFCQIGGQTGIAGHITVADGTKIQGQAGITKSTKPDSQLYGTPAIDYRGFLKSYAIFKKLPEIIHRNKR